MGYASEVCLGGVEAEAVACSEGMPWICFGDLWGILHLYKSNIPHTQSRHLQNTNPHEVAC